MRQADAGDDERTGGQADGGRASDPGSDRGAGAREWGFWRAFNTTLLVLLVLAVLDAIANTVDPGMAVVGAGGRH